MARKKNALTKYFVGSVPVSDVGPVTYHPLAKWIQTVTDDSDEETEDTGYYDGDGTPSTDIISVKKNYTFEGTYDDEDAAMKFIAGLEFATGEDRKIMFKQERTNGDVYEGKATVSEIKVTGGEATEYQAFECAISWDSKPKVTPALP